MKKTGFRQDSEEFETVNIYIYMYIYNGKLSPKVIVALPNLNRCNTCIYYLQLYVHSILCVWCVMKLRRPQNKQKAAAGAGWNSKKMSVH
jgi:hypothetical protein